MYAGLSACTSCIPAKRRAEIDQINQERAALGKLLQNPAFTGEEVKGGIVTSGPREEASPEGEAENSGASAGEVTITIKD